LNLKKILNILYNYNIFLYLCILPIILGAIYIRLFGVNVVFWDQWELVTLIEKMYTGHITFMDLFAQHNEHRILFPRIIMLALAEMTHYNTIAEMYFSWVLVIFTLILVYLMFKKDLGNSPLTWMMFVPIAWLMFSFRQFENILWGWQIQIYLATLGFIISIYFLERSEKIDIIFFMAIAGAIVSSFSFANGLAVWLAGIIYIFITEKKNQRSLLSMWILFAILTFILYFYGFQRPTVHPDPLFAFKNPSVGIQYLLAAIGSPITFEKYRGIIVGFIFSIITCIVIFHTRFNKTFLHNNAKWIALIVFSFISAILMTIGRAGLGVEQALASRYVTFTQIAFIGTYCILLNIQNKSINTKENQRFFLILVALVALIISGIFVGYTEGYKMAEDTHVYKLGISYFLLGYNFTPDEILLQLHPYVNVVKQRGEILKKYNLNVFYDHRSYLYDVKPKALLDQPFIEGAGIIDDQVKFIILEIPLDNASSIIEFENKQIPDNAVLKFDVTLDPKSWSPYKGDGVTFEIYVRENGTKKQIFSKYIDPKHNRDERKWNYNEVDLSEYGGKNATIIFSTLAGPNNDSAWDFAWWGEPRIEVAK